jgi:transcriptional regulator with PAS, ATPase and Fis domain
LVMKPKLLRVIESGEVRRIGATVDKKVDVRLIAATNKNLKQMVENNLFRQDLFYRLNVIPITIPPLRDRPDDILVLAQKFLDELNTKYKTNKFFGPQITDSLMKYHWPGNVRELKNIVERLFITSPDLAINGYDSVTISHGEHCTDEADMQLNADLSAIDNSITPDDADNKNVKLKEFLAEAEKYFIKKVIDECNGSISEAANRLGIHRSVLYRKRKSYGK